MEPDDYARSQKALALAACAISLTALALLVGTIAGVAWLAFHL